MGDDGRSYRGLVDYTESGKTCKTWTSVNKWSVAEEKATADKEIGGIMNWGNGLGNHNYCRNPDPKEGFDKPWCFTTDPKKDKEACNIEVCPEEERVFGDEAKELADTMQSGMSVSSLKDCEASDCLFGSGDTTMDTRVKFLQSFKIGRTKDGKACACRR